MNIKCKTCKRVTIQKPINARIYGPRYYTKAVCSICGNANTSMRYTLSPDEEHEWATMYNKIGRIY